MKSLVTSLQAKYLRSVGRFFDESRITSKSLSEANLAADLPISPHFTFPSQNSFLRLRSSSSNPRIPDLGSKILSVFTVAILRGLILIVGSMRFISGGRLKN